MAGQLAGHSGSGRRRFPCARCQGPSRHPIEAARRADAVAMRSRRVDFRFHGGRASRPPVPDPPFPSMTEPRGGGGGGGEGQGPHGRPFRLGRCGPGGSTRGFPCFAPGPAARGPRRDTAHTRPHAPGALDTSQPNRSHSRRPMPTNPPSPCALQP